MSVVGLGGGIGAARLWRALESLGLPATATAVAALYRDLCREFVLDRADAAEAHAIGARGLAPVLCSTLFTGQGGGDDLVDFLRMRAVVPTPASGAAEGHPRRTG